MWTSAKPNKLYITRKVLMRATRKCTFIEFEPLSKVMVIFWHFFTMPALQIWPCHVTQEANFEKNYFFLILHLILGNVTKFLVENLFTSEVISQKPHRGGKHPPPPPSAFRVKRNQSISWTKVILSIRIKTLD